MACGGDIGAMRCRRMTKEELNNAAGNGWAPQQNNSWLAIKKLAVKKAPLKTKNPAKL
ncbi:hypothetical protein P0D88_21340 [Paraburkholderia sp. RL18-103-BIB-C]|uniref:hypothetical protein n=1 Tax=Paraburkholderia sp. RL18-103-BIB-C TaxID=3031637 RepID=UPI0038B94CD1